MMISCLMSPIHKPFSQLAVTNFKFLQLNLKPPKYFKTKKRNKFSHNLNRTAPNAITTIENMILIMPSFMRKKLENSSRIILIPG